MLSADLIPGKDYAFREKRGSRFPLERIRLLEHTRGSKWKVRWVEPHPGLVDYISTSQIIVPWKDHKLFLEDETNFERLCEYNSTQGYDPKSPLANAIEQVLESMGEGLNCARGILAAPVDKISRVRTRAKLPEYVTKSPAYVDRHAILHLSFMEADDLSQNFCKAEPSTVLTEIEATERKWTHDASRPGEDYIIPLLNSYRPSWALIRQWCGLDAPIAARDQEIQRLERLLWDAIYALQKAGRDSEAARLRRALDDR